MSTRKASNDKPLRQERFASSTAMLKGILANLVAKRCHVLRSAEDRELIWFLQEVSLRPGAGPHFYCSSFPAWSQGTDGKPGELALERLARELCERFPDQIRGNAGVTERNLPNVLARLCLDPKCDFETVASGFSDLRGSLLQYKRETEAAVLKALAITSVSSAVWDSLDYCHSQKGIVLMEGAYRSGKSYAAQAWCLSRPGRVRYVQLSAFTDETSFFRLISQSLGTASSGQLKSIAMRTRVEDTLRGRDLMLVIDEAEHLMPSVGRPASVPNRLNYIIKDLDNRGIAVALLAGLNFERSLSHITRRLPSYGSEQFYGRLTLRQQLPDNLTKADLFAIVRILAPEADEPTKMLLVGFALTAEGRVGALEHTAKRARFFAERAGRSLSFDDVEAAIAEAQGPFASTNNARAARGPRGLDAGAPPATRATPTPASHNRVPSSFSPIAIAPGMFTGSRTPLPE